MAGKSEIIFVGGLRGVGKDFLIRRLIELPVVDLYSLTANAPSDWLIAESSIASEISQLAVDNGKLLVKLHYAVPVGNLKAQIENGIVPNDTGSEYSSPISDSIIRGLILGNHVFHFVLLEVSLDKLHSRIDDSSKISDGYKKSLNAMESLNKEYFYRLIESFRTMGADVGSVLLLDGDDVISSMEVIRGL